MKTLIKATAVQNRELSFALFCHENCNLVISLIFHHTMVKDETKLILKYTHLAPKLNRYNCLPFTDSFGMFFKN